MKKWFFPFFFLFTLFAEELFYGFLSARGMIVESGMLQILYIPIALVAYCILLKDFTSSYVSVYVKKFCGILFLILIMFYTTSLMYVRGNGNFASTVLYFGSICIASSTVGIHLALTQCWRKIDILLPFFLLPIGLIMGYFGFEAAARGTLLRGDETALDYQNLSYYMAEIYAFSGYYVFFSSAMGSRIHKILRWPMYAFMLFCAAIAVASGGRGAFVFLIAITMFIVYLLYKNGRMKKSTILWSVAVTGTIFALVSIAMGVWDSEGFERITNSLTEDDERQFLYILAKKSINESMIIGHGLGSVWWEVGYYCHNMFYDLMVDGGIILTGIVTYLIYRTGMNLLQWSKYEVSLVFLLFIMAKALVTTMFSGYWLNKPQLWLLFGFVFIFRYTKLYLIETQK